MSNLKLAKKFNIICAMTKNGGIGINNHLPWKSRDELINFKMHTLDSCIIMGRKTCDNLPELKKREVLCVSKTITNDKYKTFKSIETALEYANGTNKKIFIGGGSQIIKYVFENMKSSIDNVYLSVMNGEYECDSFIDVNYFNGLSLVSKNSFADYTLEIYKNTKPSSEYSYLSLLHDVMQNGTVRVGRNGETKSLFAKTLEFDLSESFPLLTTKKMFIRGIFEELIFFIRGDTNSNFLQEKKINIWKGNTTREYLDSIGMPNRKEGVMGPMYGYQWRTYNAEYDEEMASPKEAGVDQLENVVELIKNNPTSRRILMTTYNPVQNSQGVLPPCHSIVLQFYVRDGFLDCYCYNRSSDLFLGLPFNIASTSMLIMFIAKICDLKPGKFTLGLGDCHIYETHYDSVLKQIARTPLDYPVIDNIPEMSCVKDLEYMEYHSLSVKNYKCYGAIKSKMVS